ncbi:hypothetical protein GW17_00009999, partial [Ensete ventricosum]
GLQIRHLACAAMASLYPGHVGAVQVGAYFLEQYYRILQQQPELVHQFYTDVSSMARFDGTATETATGMVVLFIISYSFPPLISLMEFYFSIFSADENPETSLCHKE